MRVREVGRTFSTLLYVSGARDLDIAAVSAAGPDGLIIDLEDSVPPTLKVAARENVARWLGTGRLAPTVVLRVNDPSNTFDLEDDLVIAAASANLDAVLCPKTEKPSEIGTIAIATRTTPQRTVWAMVESQDAIEAIPSFAGATDRLRAFVIGYKDLAQDMGVEFDTANTELRSAARRALEAGKAAGRAVFDGVTLGDPETIAAAARRALDEGFDGVTLYSFAGLRAVNHILGREDR